MDNATLSVVIAGLVLLVSQSTSCFLKHRRSTGVGFINLILAVLIAGTVWAIQTGHLVAAIDFASIMVQGRAAIWFLRTALLGLALLPALCLLKLLRLKLQMPNNGEWWFIGAAVFIGVLAGFRIVPVNPTDPSYLQVFQYDVWWPGLALWLTICLSGCILLLADAFSALFWGAFTAAWTSGLAAFAVAKADLPDAASRRIWPVVEYAALPLSLGLLLLYIYRYTGLSARFKASLAILFGVCMIVFPFTTSMVHASLSVVPLLVFMTATGVLIFHQLRESKTAPQGTENILPRWNLAGIAIGLALPIVAIAVGDLFAGGYLPTYIDVAIALLFWVLFAERLSQHALDQLPQLFKDNQLQLRPVRVLLHSSRLVGRAGFRGVKTVVDYVFSGSPVTAAIKAVLIPILVVLALAALNEVFNTGKIVVSSFTWLGEKDAKEDISGVIAPAVINALGRLHYDLRQDLIIASRSQSGEHPQNVQFFSAGTDTSLSSAIAQGSDLEISGLKLPLNSLVFPIQTLARRILHIQVITGSVRKVSEGEYAVTIDSSYGRSWFEVVHASSAAPSDAEKSKPVVNSTADPPDACMEAFGARDTLSQGMEQIAFDIATGEPRFLSLGLSTNAEAFRCFRAGLQSWNRYIASASPGDLSSAITLFQDAVKHDQQFALAYYRLGLCLQKADQPGAAVDEFRASFQANPDFIPAAAWAAITLNAFSDNYPSQPAVLPPDANGIGAKAAQAQSLEAMRIWSQLLNLSHQAQSRTELQRAYYGFCDYERGELASEYAASPGTPIDQRVYYLPYFYCKRAESLFAGMQTADRIDRDERSLQAVILNDIGVALDWHKQNRSALTPEETGSGDKRVLPCASSQYAPDEVATLGAEAPMYIFVGRSRQSLRYYERSLALKSDDPVVQCNAAMAETALNRGTAARAIRQLERDTFVRSALASGLENTARSTADAKTARQYFMMALNEYQRSLLLDSASVNVLNGYAYTCWEWYVSYRRGAADIPPSWDIVNRAERYSREAVRLAYQRQNNQLLSETLDTLGELLVEQDRLSEAIIHLKEAAQAYNSWPLDHEPRWDLATAEFCAADEAQGAQHERLLGEASADLANLRKEERTKEGQLQEWHPFHPNGDLWVHDATDATQRLVCPEKQLPPDGHHWPFSMDAPSYSAGVGCGLTAVSASLLQSASVQSAQAESTALYLHIWGNNTNERIPLNSGTARSIQVEDGPDTMSGIYYAALETSEGAPWSAAKTFDVFPRSGKECSKSSIHMVFRGTAIKQ
ncbi:MAG TPA: hypothetical protein VH325_02795 [Bryobacteraceae bacterium]|jgi:hypothetical protein|nr:hypothetical protein [Bryobacteraceae bacterium]